MQAVVGAVGGMLGDQWKDFYTMPDGAVADGGAVRRSAARDQCRSRLQHPRLQNIISNGSKIMVPEGYGLLLMQDGKITSFAAEPAAYEWERSDDVNSKSIFAGDGLVSR